MRIGILQTGHAPDQLIGTLGDYPDLFKRLLEGHEYDFAVWSVVDGAFPPGPEAADGWLITGSRHGVCEDLPWIGRLEALSRAIAASGRPLIGVGFGHQAMAQGLGGKVEKCGGGWSVGRQVYDFGDARLALNAWHQDQVVELPPGAQVIASSPACKFAALVIGDNVLTVQPHPEFSAEMMAGLIEYRAAKVPPGQIKAARSTLAQPTDEAEMAARMAAFFAKGAK